MYHVATPVAIPARPDSFPLPLLVLAAVCSLLSFSSIRAQDKPVEGQVVQIPTTITTEIKDRLRANLAGPLKRFADGPARQGGRFVLVCDFNPDGKTAACDDFGASYSLATFLRSLHQDHPGVTTVAFVHGDVRAHSVLPALACSTLVFSNNGRLGQVAAKGIPRPEQAAYEEVTKNRYPLPLVRKMFDPNVEVVKAGDQYLDSNQKPRPAGVPVDGLPFNEVAFYPFAQARELGLCQQQASADVAAVALLYNLPRTGPQRSLDQVVCWRIPVEGMFTGELVEQTKRRVERAIKARATHILLDLSCGGGEPDEAYKLGMYLAGLKERKLDVPVETIAFVRATARNLAVFPAFGCNRIVLQQEGDAGKELNPDAEDDSLPGVARLGGFSHYLTRHPQLEELQQPGQPPPADLEQRKQKVISDLEESLSTKLTDVAKKQMYSPVLAAGMVNRGMRIHLVERAVGAAGGQTYLTEEQYQADQRGKKEWRSVKVVKPWLGQPRHEGRYLTLTAGQAKELGVAHAVVKDLDDLYTQEGLPPAEVRTVEPDWLDGLAEFLRSPWTSAFLVMIGITCLILELKMPGVGLPGVVAAICFVLFFWSHSQLHGQITWLAILLFVLGLVLIGIEIFVLPGFGVCGISGVLLLLVSLGLIAYGHWPTTTEEWMKFGNKAGPFSLSLLGSLVMVAVIVRYLPHIPVLNRLMLRPADEAEADLTPEHPQHAELRALLGAIGVAATPLRPAGKTQFGESFIDVVAEGGYIRPGTRVQVVEVEGNRVVVKEV